MTIDLVNKYKWDETSNTVDLTEFCSETSKSCVIMRKTFYAELLQLKWSTKKKLNMASQHSATILSIFLVAVFWQLIMSPDFLHYNNTIVKTRL